jgi:endonuclease/exonuclease/phosphatase family metal-dependent hydrolase
MSKKKPWGRTIRIMTWNVSTGSQWKSIVKFGRSQEVDIIGLQEVDNNFRESTRSLDACKAIGDALGFYTVYCPSIEISLGDSARQYGNCIVSKHPIMKHRRYLLNPEAVWDGKTAETEPRTLLHATIRILDADLHFMTLHLAYSRGFIYSDSRMRQVQKVIDVIERNSSYPIVLLGDFNALPNSPEIAEIEQYLENTDKKGRTKTWTTRDSCFQGWYVPKGLKYKVDYIFVSKSISYQIVKIPRTDISDHVPIVLDISFTERDQQHSPERQMSDKDSG